MRRREMRLVLRRVGDEEKTLGATWKRWVRAETKTKCVVWRSRESMRVNRFRAEKKN